MNIHQYINVFVKHAFDQNSTPIDENRKPLQPPVFDPKIEIDTKNNAKHSTKPESVSSTSANYKDRFNGAVGDERKKLIEDEARSKGYTIVKNTITPLDQNTLMVGLTKILKEKFPQMEDDILQEFIYVLMSQIKLETGFKSCHNFNIGNYHATPNGKNKYWKGLVSVWNDPQVSKDGKKYINVDWFWRAYDTLDEGLGDWLGFLERKFPTAFEYAKNGDAYNYGMELGKGGYYTANKSVYSKGLVKIKDSLKKKKL